MKGAIERLRAEIKSDRAAIARCASEANSQVKLLGSDEGAKARVAVALHHAYGAMEAIMERTTRFFEKDPPVGGDWHQQLLQSMALELEGIRPTIFSSDTVRLLRPLLAFRHFFRNAYAIELDGDRLTDLTQTLTEANVSLETDLDELDCLLKQLAE